MAGKDTMSNDEYYQYYLEQTKQNNTQENKGDKSKLPIVIVSVLALSGGLYYIWQDKNHTLEPVARMQVATQAKQTQNKEIEAARIAKIEAEKKARLAEAKAAKIAKEKEIARIAQLEVEKKARLAEEKAAKIAKEKELETARITKIKAEKKARLAKEKEIEAARIAWIEAEKKARLAEAKAAKIAKEKELETARFTQLETKKKKETKEKVTLSKKIKEEQKKIQNLELSLLSGIEESKTPTISTISNKKVDTFNKIIIKTKDAKNNSKKENRSEKPIDTKYTQALNTEAETRKDEMQYVIVKKGDTLYDIAKKIYGDAMKYPIIFEANPDILNDPSRIFKGQKLRVPKIAKDVS